MELFSNPCVTYKDILTDRLIGENLTIMEEASASFAIQSDFTKIYICEHFMNICIILLEIKLYIFTFLYMQDEGIIIKHLFNWLNMSAGRARDLIKVDKHVVVKPCKKA